MVLILAVILRLTVTTAAASAQCCIDSQTMLFRTVALPKPAKPDGTYVTAWIGRMEDNGASVCQLANGTCDMDIEVPDFLVAPFVAAHFEKDCSGKSVMVTPQRRTLLIGYEVRDDCAVDLAAPQITCPLVQRGHPVVRENSVRAACPGVAPVGQCASEPKTMLITTGPIDAPCEFSSAGCKAGVPVEFDVYVSPFTPWTPLGCESYTWCFGDGACVQDNGTALPAASGFVGRKIAHTYAKLGDYEVTVTVKGKTEAVAVRSGKVHVQ